MALEGADALGNNPIYRNGALIGRATGESHPGKHWDPANERLRA